MVEKCPPGMIRRKGYTRSDGVRVKSVCVRDMGKKGKTPAKGKVLPQPRTGGLSDFGYDNIKGTLAATRRRALVRGVDHDGYATIVRRLNLLANYNKTTDPGLHTKVRGDMAWLKKRFRS